MVTIKPATVLKWHRQLQRRNWNFNQRRLGRPPVDEKILLLVIEMKHNNPRWGARRIKDELRKIDITLSKSAICTLLNGSDFPPSAPKFDETWIPFLNIPAIYHCELAGKVFLDCCEVRLYRPPPRTPNCNAFIERWNRTIREELLDRRIFFGRRDLQQVVDEYVAYYNERRPHQSLDLNAPIQKFDSKINFDSKKICRNRIIDGLVLDYRIAA